MKNMRGTIGTIVGCALILIWCLLPVAWIISRSKVVRCSSRSASSSRPSARNWSSRMRNSSRMFSSAWCSVGRGVT